MTRPSLLPHLVKIRSQGSGQLFSSVNHQTKTALGFFARPGCGGPDLRRAPPGGQGPSAPSSPALCAQPLQGGEVWGADSPLALSRGRGRLGRWSPRPPGDSLWPRLLPGPAPPRTPGPPRGRQRRPAATRSPAHLTPHIAARPARPEGQDAGRQDPDGRHAPRARGHGENQGTVFSQADEISAQFRAETRQPLSRGRGFLSLLVGDSPLQMGEGISA